MAKVKCPNCQRHIVPQPRNGSRQVYYRCLYCDPIVTTANTAAVTLLPAETKKAITITHGQRFDTSWPINNQQEPRASVDRNMFLVGLWAGWVLFKRYGFQAWEMVSNSSISPGYNMGLARIKHLTERYAIVIGKEA